MTASEHSKKRGPIGPSRYLVGIDELIPLPQDGEWVWDRPSFWEMSEGDILHVARCSLSDDEIYRLERAAKVAKDDKA